MPGPGPAHQPMAAAISSLCLACTAGLSMCRAHKVSITLRPLRRRPDPRGWPAPAISARLAVLRIEVGVMIADLGQLRRVVDQRIARVQRIPIEVVEAVLPLVGDHRVDVAAQHRRPRMPVLGEEAVRAGKVSVAAQNSSKCGTPFRWLALNISTRSIRSGARRQASSQTSSGRWKVFSTLTLGSKIPRRAGASARSRFQNSGAPRRAADCVRISGDQMCGARSTFLLACG